MMDRDEYNRVAAERGWITEELFRREVDQLGWEILELTHSGDAHWKVRLAARTAIGEPTPDGQPMRIMRKGSLSEIFLELSLGELI